MKKLFTVWFVAAVVVGCSKDGEDGATGPQGAQGSQGEQGIQGPQGEQGDPGTANVSYSDWVNTGLGNNIVSTSESFTISAPEIGPDMLNFGTVLVYGRRVDPALGNLVYQLPVVFGGARQQTYYFRAQQDEIRITVAANQEGQPAGDGTFFGQYRYILIPGGVSITGKSGATVDFGKMDYDQVVLFLGIPE